MDKIRLPSHIYSASLFASSEILRVSGQLRDTVKLLSAATFLARTSESLIRFTSRRMVHLPTIQVPGHGSRTENDWRSQKSIFMYRC